MWQPGQRSSCSRRQQQQPQLRGSRRGALAGQRTGHQHPCPHAAPPAAASSLARASQQQVPQPLRRLQQARQPLAVLPVGRCTAAAPAAVQTLPRC